MTTRALVLSLIMLFTLTSVPHAYAASTPAKPITCTVGADVKVIKPGEKTSIYWKSSRSIITYGPSGTTVAPFGSIEVAPTKTTIYKFKFVGVGGNKKCGVRIRVQGDEVAP